MSAVEAFVIRDADTGGRLAASFDPLTCEEKAQAAERAGRRVWVESVHVSKRRPRKRPSSLPPGYEVRSRRRLAASTLRRPWPGDWRWWVLRPIIESGEEWYALRGGHELAPLTNALQARGLIDIAEHPREAYLYRVTPAGHKAYGQLSRWG